MRTEIQSGIKLAIDGLYARQNATSNNISNIETPGFLAKRVDFESSLRKALSGRDTDATPTTSVSLDETRQDGNNVNLDNETVTAIETQLRYQAMVEAMNSQFRQLRTAMS